VASNLKYEAMLYLVQYFESPIAVKVFVVCAYGSEVQTHKPMPEEDRPGTLTLKVQNMFTVAAINISKQDGSGGAQCAHTVVMAGATSAVLT